MSSLRIGYSKVNMSQFDDMPYHVLPPRQQRREPNVSTHQKRSRERSDAPTSEEREPIEIRPLGSYSNAVKQAAVLAHKYGHAEVIAEVTAALSKLTKEFPQDIAEIVSAIGSISKAISRDAQFTPEDVLSAYQHDREELENTSSRKPLVQLKMVYYGNLVSYCKSVPKVEIVTSDKEIKLKHRKSVLTGTVTSYGAIAWGPDPVSFVKQVSNGEVEYSTTGSLTADYLIMSFCMHHRIMRSGAGQGEVKLSVDERKFSGNMNLLDSFPPKDEIWPAVNCLKSIYKEFKRHTHTKITQSWAGDATPVIIKMIGPLSVQIARQQQDKIAIAIRALNTRLASLAPRIKLNTHAILGDPIVHAYVNDHDLGGTKTATKVIDAATAYRGANSDTAHTTLRTLPSVHWWLGENIARRWSAAITMINQTYDHPSVTYLGAEDSASAIFLQAVFPNLRIRRIPIVKGRPQFSRVDVQKCDVVLCDYESSPPAEVVKGSTMFTSYCNAQTSHINSILQRSKHAATIIIRCFPQCQDIVSYAYLESCVQSLRDTHPNFGFLPGDAGDHLEVMLALTSATTTNTFPWRGLGDVPTVQVWDLLSSFMCVYSVDLCIYTCNALNLGVLVAGHATDLLVKGIIVSTEPTTDDVPIRPRMGMITIDMPKSEEHYDKEYVPPSFEGYDPSYNIEEEFGEEEEEEEVQDENNLEEEEYVEDEYDFTPPPQYEEEQEEDYESGQQQSLVIPKTPLLKEKIKPPTKLLQRKAGAGPPPVLPSVIPKNPAKKRAQPQKTPSSAGSTKPSSKGKSIFQIKPNSSFM